MAISTFDKIIADAQRAGKKPGPESADWFRAMARKTRSSPEQLIRGSDKNRVTATPKIGRMYAFHYDPKHKKKLPYYDTFPLVLPLEPYSDGFLGINFHYLPMTLRLKLLDRVVDYSNNTKFDESTRLAVDYSKLKKINLIKPALKRYLAGNVKTQFRRIDADEFTVAVLLPIARWKKGSIQQVYSDSRSMI